MTHAVKLVWATPNIDQMLIYMARISVPEDKRNLPGAKLIAYLLEHKHNSPFDMANLCVEFQTTREISRQVMRHWSMKENELPAQEFSQRYSDPTAMGPVFGEARLQDTKNRQQSIETVDESLEGQWQLSQREIWETASRTYDEFTRLGMAKEVARRILPEGLTPTRFDINGRIRSWLYFCDLRRRSAGAQKEIEVLAEGVWQLLREHAPITVAAWEMLKAKEEENKRKIAFADWAIAQNGDFDILELLAKVSELGRI